MRKKKSFTSKSFLLAYHDIIAVLNYGTYDIAVSLCQIKGLAVILPIVKWWENDPMLLVRVAGYRSCVHFARKNIRCEEIILSPLRG